MRTFILALALAGITVSCGPKKTGEQVAEEVCTCVKTATDAMMADVDKYAAADTSNFKADMMNDANTKLAEIVTKVSECKAKVEEKDESIATLADQKEKALFDEKSGECMKNYTDRVEKAKAKLMDLNNQFTAAADSAKAKLEKETEKAKAVVQKVIPTNRKK